MATVQRVDAAVQNRLSSVSLRWLLLLMVVLTIRTHLHPDKAIVDDGYFYPQIARHIAHGEGSTFNGITSTNGYHPLWMLVCIAAAWVTSASAPLLQLLLSVQDLLTILSLILLVKICDAAGKRGAFVGCLPILLLAVDFLYWRLLEANLAFLLQICVLLLVLPLLPNVQHRLKSTRDVVLGVLLGLTLLARLDLIFFAAVIALFELFRRRATFAIRLRAAAVQVSCASLLVVPYLIWNKREFHHLEPISGALKSTFPHVHSWDLEWYVWVCLCAILVNALLLFRRRRTSFDLLCILTSAAAALHLAFTLTFGDVTLWYLTTSCLTLSLSVIWVTDWILSKWPRLLTIESMAEWGLFFTLFCVGVLHLFTAFSYNRTVRNINFGAGRYSPSRELADTLRSTLPPGSRIFIFDAPGEVAFFSGMDIVPADGLVMNWSYNDELIREGIGHYFATHDIRYFITPYIEPGQTYDALHLHGTRAGNTQTMHVEAPLTRQDVGVITLPDSSLILKARGITPILTRTMPWVGVWRIDSGSSPSDAVTGGSRVPKVSGGS